MRIRVPVNSAPSPLRIALEAAVFFVGLASILSLLWM